MIDDPPPLPGGHALSSAHVAALLDAVIAVGRELHLETVLRRVVTSATELVGSRYGALGVLDAKFDGLADFLHVGFDPDDVEAIGALPEGRGLLGQLISAPHPLRVDDLAAHPDAVGFPPHHRPMSSFLGVPIRVRGDVFGNLYLTDKIVGGPFTEEDEQLAVALASVAGVAIENWRLHERLSELAVVEERERIARALHDTVIQRIFSIGLNLEGAAALIEDPDVSSRLQRAAADLDETVDEIRATVLNPADADAPRRPVSRELTELIDEVADRIGMTASIRFDGDVDGIIGLDSLGHVADHLFASARNGLVALHEHGDVREVELSVGVAHELTLTIRTATVVDAIDSDWFVELEQRARTLDGHATLITDGTGSEIVWTVPLDHEAPL